MTSSGKLVFFATSWGSAHGGLNAFNFDIVNAMRRLATPNALVDCVVPLASNDDAIVIPGDYASGVFSDSSPLERLASRNTWWIGHDAHTGRAALRAKESTGVGRVAIFLHADPLAYEHIKGRSAQDALAKRQVQREILSCADVVFAVGPRLEARAAEILRESSCRSTPCICVCPGISAEWEPSRPATFRAITHGRFDDAVAALKQADLVAAAFGNAVLHHGNDLGPDPTLYVLGTDRADDFVEIARTRAQRAVGVLPLPFSTDRDEVGRILQTTSLALTLSIHEGFGLSAWDAISAGIPLIVSENTGVYELIRDRLGGAGLGCLESIDVRGPIRTSDAFNELDVERVSGAILRMCRKGDRAFRDARSLRSQLLREKMTWESAAQVIAATLGVNVRPPVAPRDQSIVGTTDPAVAPTASTLGKTTGIDPCDLFETATKSRQSADWVRLGLVLAQTGKLHSASLVFSRAVAAAGAQDRKGIALEWCRTEARRRAVSVSRMESELIRSAELEDLSAIVAVLELAEATGTSKRLADLTAKLIPRLIGHADPQIAMLCRKHVDRFVPAGQSSILWRPVPGFLAESRPITEALSVCASFLDYIDSAPKRRSPIEAPWLLTRAYIEMEHACLLARLGQEARAERAFSVATEQIDLDDPVHSFVVRRYARRLFGRRLVARDKFRRRAHGLSLDMISLYKVYRIFASSSTLDPMRLSAAIEGAWLISYEKPSIEFFPNADVKAFLQQVERLDLDASSGLVLRALLTTSGYNNEAVLAAVSAPDAKLVRICLAASVAAYMGDTASMSRGLVLLSDRLKSVEDGELLRSGVRFMELMAIIPQAASDLFLDSIRRLEILCKSSRAREPYERLQMARLVARLMDYQGNADANVLRELWGVWQDMTDMSSTNSHVAIYPLGLASIVLGAIGDWADRGWRLSARPPVEVA